MPHRCRDDVYNLEEMTASLLKDDESMEEAEKLAFICTCAIDSVRVGGSVLVPIDRLGIFLCLLEQMSLFLESSSQKVLHSFSSLFLSGLHVLLLVFTQMAEDIKKHRLTVKRNAGAHR